MTLRVLDTARTDLASGYWFYEEQNPGVGSYFLTSIYSDLHQLSKTAGVHRKLPDGSHRMNARKFPYAIYYRINGGAAEVHAILDSRRSPEWIRQRLRDS